MSFDRIYAIMRGPRGGKGDQDPLRNHKNMGLLSNTGPVWESPEKSQSYQAGIQCYAIIGTPVKHNLIVIN